MSQSAPSLPEGIWERRDDKEVRDLIILTYWPMLTRVVGRIRQSLPPHVRVDEDDLRSYGLIGMYKALERFNPSLGFAFDKFASNFVRGAVLDELRSQDWAPRSLRKRQKEMDRATHTLAQQLKRTPTVDEIAEFLRWTVSDVSSTREQISTAWPRSLDELRGEAQRDLYSLVADAQGQIEKHVLTAEESPENDRSLLLNDKMSEYLYRLSPQKLAVVVLRYYLDLKQAEVARILGITETRVSTVHKEVMEEIHVRLEELLTAQT